MNDHHPSLQQVKMMHESGDQKHGWQDNSCADEITPKGSFSDKNKMVNRNEHPSRKTEFADKPHETTAHKQDKVVAGARSNLALGNNIALRKDKMVAGVHNHLNLLFSAIGLSERNITI